MKPPESVGDCTRGVSVGVGAADEARVGRVELAVGKAIGIGRVNDSLW